MVYFTPCHSLSRAPVDLKVGGAFSSSRESYTLMRMTACGQTIAHLPHWIHVLGSQTGISSARLRFSHLAVPVGNVPSQEKALTGSSSPWPAYIAPSTSRSYSGAFGENGAGIRTRLVVFSGTLISNRWASVSSTAARFFSTKSSPFFP